MGPMVPDTSPLFKLKISRYCVDSGLYIPQWLPSLRFENKSVTGWTAQLSRWVSSLWFRDESGTGWTVCPTGPDASPLYDSRQINDWMVDTLYNLQRFLSLQCGDIQHALFKQSPTHPQSKDRGGELGTRLYCELSCRDALALIKARL